MITKCEALMLAVVWLIGGIGFGIQIGFWIDNYLQGGK